MTSDKNTNDGGADRVLWNARAAAIFPSQFARANDSTRPGRSKRLHNLRNRAKVYTKLEELRAEGKSCAGCASFEKRSHWSTPHEMMRCARGSDFHGDLLALPDGICTEWSAREISKGDAT